MIGSTAWYVALCIVYTTPCIISEFSDNTIFFERNCLAIYIRTLNAVIATPSLLYLFNLQLPLLKHLNFTTLNSCITYVCRILVQIKIITL